MDCSHLMIALDKARIIKPDALKDVAVGGDDDGVCEHCCPANIEEVGEIPCEIEPEERGKIDAQRYYHVRMFNIEVAVVICSSY